MLHSKNIGMFLTAWCVLFCLTCEIRSETKPSSESGPSDDALSKAFGPPFYSGSILPTPQEAAYGKEAIALFDGPKGLSLSGVEFDYHGPARKLLLQYFETRIDDYRKLFQVSWTAANNGSPVKIVFAQASEPKAQAWIARYKLEDRIKRLPSQGYVLEVRPEGIVGIGADDQGMVNAMASFLQLLHIADGKLVIQQASITDWPTFVTRYTSDYKAPTSTDFFDWMLKNKINGYSCGYADYIDWRGLTDKQRNDLKMIGDFVRKYKVMSYMAQIHIGGLLQRVPAVDEGDPEQVAKLLNTVEDILKLSDADRVLILYDDVFPKLGPKAQTKFQRKGQATGYLLNKLYERMQTVRPGTKLIFCPPCYQGRAHQWWRKDYKWHNLAVQYMADLRQWNPNIIIFWTGPVTESLKIVPGDIEHYQGLIGKDRKLAYWDNTWHTHQPLRNFHAEYPKNFVNACADGMSYIHVYALSPIGQFFSLTANDYYWNPNSFDAAQAWRQAATQTMGPEVIPVLERFYKLRGEVHSYDYAQYLANRPDLKKFGEIASELEKTSWTPEIPREFRQVYNEAVKYEKKK